MSNPSVPSYVRSKLEEIAWDHSFVGGTYEIRFEPGSKTGDGFIGQMVRATIRGDRLLDGTKLLRDQELKLICKIPLDDPVQREKFNSMLLFEREVLVYNEVLPEFERLQLARGLWRGDEVGFWNFPRCYWASFDADQGESMLIMEDLVERDLELKDKYVLVDYDHVKVLMVALGKMNACSFALREQKPEVFERFKRLNDLLSIVMMTEQTKPLARRNCELAASIFIEEDADERRWRDRFLELKDCIWEKTETLMASQKAEPYGAFNHGDCWTNNVMFGYDKSTNRVQEIVLLDWQMARYGSPILDLLSFLYLCGEIDLRREHFNDLIDTFYTSFAKTFRALGGQPEKSFPFEAIHEQMKLFGAQVLTMSTFAFPILSQLPEEFFDKTADRSKAEFQPQFNRYKQLMKDICRDSAHFDDLE
ncbi:AAEL012679-PA [Aedes aegypti]|uniref:AAEL012679-PA n=2 Tax=Aedes aegypti TaxID=7159 RepID=A0A1S4FWX1_AEDAE|nr:uncharacterized protein LOC5576655 [Aedes aegypti]EAT35122.1 AAEL012679-PA [Aedes aegypti]